MEDLVANYLRVTSALEIEKANSGHPGVCLGASPIFEAIYNNAFVIPKSPDFIGRDRVVISAGHSSALLYATLNLYGFGISKDDLRNFRKFGSITTGHPEVKVTPGVDTTTGPLGQGIANAVGFAIAEEYLRAKFSKKGFSPIDNYTYCFCGDGCLMEGVALEAISIAGNLKLNKLILLYDKNDITIEGSLEIANTEKTKEKFLACNWNVLEVKNGNNVLEIEKNIEKAKHSDKPTIIIIQTKIGFGSELEGSNKVHGKPLNKSQIESLKAKLNYNFEDFEIPNEVQKFIEKIKTKNDKRYQEYLFKLEKYKKENPKEYALLSIENEKIDFSSIIFRNCAEKWDGRSDLHTVLNFASEKFENLIGGSADVTPSTKTNIDNSSYFSKSDRSGRNIPFGIREHAMGAICNGISLYSPIIRSFCSTFFVFENYMIPSIRMSALMDNPVLYLFTHDSISVGEDGPTHQPIEQISTLRAMPNLLVFRPCGRNELVASFETFFSGQGPVAILIPRQVTNGVDDNYLGAKKGGYKIVDFGGCDLTIVSTGSEVSLCVDASKMLFQNGIKANVVSIPSVELFERQTKSYKSKVIDKSKPVFCVEASSDNVWYKYVTNEDCLINITDFGKSGSANDVCDHFGFTSEKIVKYIRNKLKNN